MTETPPAVGGNPRAGAHRLAFGLGSAAVVAGVLLHIPMFAAARDRGYALRGMAVDRWMVAGMVLIGAGLVACVVGLLPARERRSRGPALRVDPAALDRVRLGAPHVWLLAVLTIAIAIDAQKPFTFTFILPAVAREYGLSTPAHHLAGQLPVALLPFSGILGTVIGSFAWGCIADRAGRRASILLAALLFVGTSICGAMPSFLLNVVMCFVMGLGVGGMLPITYALLAEVLPARRRGQAVVLVAGIGTGLGFLLASGLSKWLIPHFGWRIMWLVGLPTGVLLLGLNRFIPESPRFLGAVGRAAEARRVMGRFGAALVPEDAAHPVTATPLSAARGEQRPLRWITAALGLYGLAWGIVNFGFLTWLPTDIAGRSLSVSQVTDILTNAALFSLPGALVVSWLYGRWSSKGTMVLAALLTTAALAGFAIAGDGIGRHVTAITALLVCLLIPFWGVISVLAPYSAEVYPTRVRAGGAGLAAGASKLGGVLALGMGVAGVAPPGVAASAAIAAIAMGAAALVVGAFGIETRRRRLEEIAPAGASIVPT